MASSSSSALEGFSLSNQSSYEVFLSFRGEDTRHTFTDHLFQALVRAGLRTFRDNEEIDRGQELESELERAIIESRASIVVLSENYAKSTWCLEELWLILEHRRKCNHFVVPVFYHVRPSDVRNHRRSFAIEVKEDVEGSKWTRDNVNRWKATLTEVANLTGFTVSGSETNFIAKIVDTVDCKLDPKLLSTPVHLTGMVTRAEAIHSWVKDEECNAKVLAICGMGGSGKTTLAQYIYNLNRHNYESSSFVEEIGKHYKQPGGLIDLQRQLLRDVRGKNVLISNVSEGTHKIEEALQRKRVLIVLDDIDDHDEVNILLGTKTFHTQSKIIITTRLLDIDAQVYKLELLNDIESLELLSWHAFGSKIPLEGFKELAIQLAQYCGGNPLALKVLGSSLQYRDETPQKRNSMIEVWRSKLNSLNSSQGDLDSKIQYVLQKSFHSLPCDSHKELFLHIACFFVGESEDDVVGILENDWYAKSGIRILINKCLLTISPCGKLVMHQLLQDMGRKMVRNESKDPTKRSRVWCSDESYRLLSKGEGSKKIEGLSLDIIKLIRIGTKPLPLKTDSLVKMKNLKLLELIYVELIGPYTNFPELSWLCWRGCQLKTIPFGLLMSRRLVALNMGCGKLEKFEPPTVLCSLKTLDLRCSIKLVSICGFSLLPKLESLLLGNCSSLADVCKTIGDLRSLNKLDLTGCTKLWKASGIRKFVNQLERFKALFVGGEIPEQPLFSLPQSLKVLLLGYCDLEFKNDVRVAFHAQSSIAVSLMGDFEFLPHNIDLTVLRVLHLSYCPNLKSLPCLPSTLQELHIDWCSSLERITFQSARYSLQEIDYEGCFRLCEIQGLLKLVPIAKIDEADLGDMKWIKAYQDHKVDLVGDEITKGRDWHIQMLYEYGIRSTYLQGINDQNMTTDEYTSSSNFLSFHVPSMHPNKRRIKGLNVSCLYRSAGKDKDMLPWFVKISNRTKGLTWIYNPLVYCNPKVDEDVVWLSYWPIGNILDEGDEVIAVIIKEPEMIVSKCGASLVYANGEVEEEKNCEIYTIEGQEVIGGDLSEFEVTIGGYYLCRRDFFKSETSYYLNNFFGDNIHYPNSQGWRKVQGLLSSHLKVRKESYSDLKVYKETILNVDPTHLCTFKKIELGVSFSSESQINKMEEAVSSLVGVESVSTRVEIGRLVVTGCFDADAVITCVGKFEKMVKMLRVDG